METTKAVANLIRAANKDTVAMDLALASENPVALALAILDQCGYSATVTAKIAVLLEVVS